MAIYPRPARSCQAYSQPTWRRAHHQCTRALQPQARRCKMVASKYESCPDTDWPAAEGWGRCAFIKTSQAIITSNLLRFGYIAGVFRWFHPCLVWPSKTAEVAVHQLLMPTAPKRFTSVKDPKPGPQPNPSSSTTRAHPSNRPPGQALWIDNAKLYSHKDYRSLTFSWPLLAFVQKRLKLLVLAKNPLLAVLSVLNNPFNQWRPKPTGSSFFQSSIHPAGKTTKFEPLNRWPGEIADGPNR